MGVCVCVFDATRCVFVFKRELKGPSILMVHLDIVEYLASRIDLLTFVFPPLVHNSVKVAKGWPFVSSPFWQVSYGAGRGFGGGSPLGIGRAWSQQQTACRNVQPVPATHLKKTCLHGPPTCLQKARREST